MASQVGGQAVPGSTVRGSLASLVRGASAVGASVLGVGLLIVLWWVGSLYLGARVLPPPDRTAETFLSIITYSPAIALVGGGREGLWPHLLHTAATAIAGSVIGTGLGIAGGLALSWSRRLRDFFELPIELLRTVPPLAAVPLFLMWFHRGLQGQLLLVGYFCFVRLVIFTLEAVHNVPPVHTQFALTLGATRGQVFRTIVWPAIVPELTSGLRVVLPTAYGLEIIAEMMGAQSGVGRVFPGLVQLVAVSEIMATVLWVLLLAILTDVVIVRLTGRATRWMPSDSMLTRE